MADTSEAVQQQPWTFVPADIEPLVGESTSLAVIAPAIEILGSTAMRLGLTRPDFTPTAEQYYLDQSVILQTPQGPVRYLRSTNTLAVEYPKTAGHIPDELIADTLQVEKAELHKELVYEQEKPPRKETTLKGNWRFPDETKDNHYWLHERDGTARWFANSAMEQEVVLNGQLGRLSVPEPHTIALADIQQYEVDYGAFVEEQPRVTDTHVVQEMERLFQQLAVNVAKQFGGATQLSTEIYEKHPMRTSFWTETILEGVKAAKASKVARKMAVRGFDTDIYQRTPGEHVDPGYKVVVGNRTMPYGTETLVAYEGLSTFWYTRGERQWKLYRGVVLKDTVAVSDITSVQRPLIQSSGK